MSDAWILAAVDLLDEMDCLRVSASHHDSSNLHRLSDQITRYLTSIDCRLIDEDEWSPEFQRAVSVCEVLSSGDAPRIAGKGATGVITRGRLIRKQEISLKIPPNPKYT